MKRWLIVLIIPFFLLSCGQPSPQDYAKADDIRSETFIEEAWARIKMEREEIRLFIKNATKEDWVAFWQNVIWWLCVCVCICIIGTAGGYLYFGVWKGGKAVAKRADLQAQVINVRKDTRTLPVLVDWEKGRILNLNTGEMQNIQAIQGVNDKQLALFHRVCEVGLIAQAAERIAGSTKDAKPGDMLPGIAASVPLLEDESIG